MIDLKNREETARKTRQKASTKNRIRVTNRVRSSDSFIETVFIPGREKIQDCCMSCGVSFDEVERKITQSKKGTRRTNRCGECSRKKANESNLVRKKKWMEFKKEYIRDRGGCLRCNFKDLTHVSVFVFHHRNPTEKKGHLSTIMGAGFSQANQKLFLEEAEKCDILCRNCHAIVHEEEV